MSPARARARQGREENEREKKEIYKSIEPSIARDRLRAPIPSTIINYIISLSISYISRRSRSKSALPLAPIPPIISKPTISPILARGTSSSYLASREHQQAPRAIASTLRLQ